jgi:hypothetical protein
MLPIFDYRRKVGDAKSINDAKRKLAKMLTIPKGFTLDVWRRPLHLQEILGLPDGFVYAISYKYK